MISEDYNTNNHPVSTLTDEAQHMAGKKLLCRLECSKAYHYLQMADQRCIEMLAFNFASRVLAFRRLAQGHSCSLLAFSSSICKHLANVIKADQCAQCVDNIARAANDAEQLINNLRATFQCIQNSGLKLTMHKCQCGATKIDSLGRTNTPARVKRQRPRLKTSWKIRNYRNQRALQRYLVVLNCYRNYIPTLSEKRTPFFKLC